MKLSFNPPRDGKVHSYCLRCGNESVSATMVKGRLHYRCAICGAVEPRALIVDPGINWWLDGDGEYWHEAAGIFVGNGRGEFLFFERTRFPFGLTVPAGHVDAGELALAAAVRELREETGVRSSRLVHVATDDVRGDQCRRGSDAHRWHSYATTVDPSTKITVDEREGVRPVWLSLAQARRGDLTFVTRYVINRHARSMSRAV